MASAAHLVVGFSSGSVLAFFAHLVLGFSSGSVFIIPFHIEWLAYLHLLLPLLLMVKLLCEFDVGECQKKKLVWGSGSSSVFSDIFFYKQPPPETSTKCPS